MEAQTPAEGILLQKDWGDAKTYVIECECTDPDHAHTLDVEADENFGVNVTIYTKSQTPFWRMSRWKMMWKLLTKGVVEYEVALILREQPAVNYVKALKKAIKDVKEFTR